VVRHIILSVILLLFGSTLACAETGTVLVFPFENQSNERNLDWISEGISELIIGRLQSEPGLYVFQRDERAGAFDRLGIPEPTAVTRATTMKLGWDTGADRVVTGRFTASQANFSIYARIIDLATYAASQEVKVSGKLDDVIPLTNALSWQVLKMIVPVTRTLESDYTSRPPIPRSALENYIRGLLSNDPRRRNDYFENAIRLLPQYGAAFLQLGRLKQLQGQFRESNQRLEKIGPSDPSYIFAQFAIGLNDMKLGDYSHAVSVFTGLPQTYDVLVNLGDAQSGKGDSPSAIAVWRRAADADPLAVEAVFDIGYGYFIRGEIDTAARRFEQTLRLQGRDAEAMFLLGKSLERLGRIEESQKLISQAIRISPRLERWLAQPLPKLERIRANANITSLRTGDTLNLWTPARLARRAKGQDLKTWLDYVQSEVDSQFYGEAIRELSQAMHAYPNSPDAHMLMAQIYDRQKSYDQAVGEYELSISLRPSVDAYVMLAKVQRLLNQNALALRAVEQALRLEPSNAAALAMKAELQKVTPKKEDSDGET